MTLDELETRYQARRAAEANQPPIDYEWNPQREGFTHTPQLGQELVDLLRGNGFPTAQLVGSVAQGRPSIKDIDILIPIRTKTAKSRCIDRLRQLLRPGTMALPRGMDGFGMVAKPYGVLDFFFNDRHK